MDENNYQTPPPTPSQMPNAPEKKSRCESPSTQSAKIDNKTPTHHFN